MRRAKQTPITSIKEIAEKARVSIGTVDRVLHNRKGVSKETKAKIQRIVTATGYTPNIYARNLSLAKTYRFGVLMPKLTQDSGYWQIPAEGIKKAARELHAYKVHVSYFHFDRYSDVSFRNAVHKAFGDHLDGFLIAPVLSHAVERLLPAVLHKAPFVFIDSNIPTMNCLTFIGQDAFQSGLLAANLVRMVMRTRGNVVIIKVNPEDFHIDERIKGFQKGIREFSKVRTKLYEIDSHRGEKEFYKLTAKIIRENKNLQAVFVSNAWTHPFAGCIHSLMKDRKVFIIGYDLVSKNIQLLRQGLIDVLISQRPEMQGYEGIHCLYRNIVLREKVRKHIWVPLDIITKENVQFYQQLAI